MTGEAKCKYCGRLILYARNVETGKDVPIDTAPAIYEAFNDPRHLGTECKRLRGLVGVNHFAT